MIAQALSTPENAAFGVIAFLIMFLNFVGICMWTVLRDKNYLEKMENFPLDN